MKFKNPLQMNDWNIKDFILNISIITLILIFLSIFDMFGFRITVLLNIIGIFYLTFIPGVIFLRILRIHKLNILSSLILQICLSLSLLAFFGFFINLIYPIFGITKPLSFFNIFISLIIFIMLSCLVCYLRDKDFSDPDFIKLNKFPSPIVFFLGLMPFLSIIGTYLVTYDNSNVLLMFLILIIGITILLFAWGYIPKKLYPFAVYVISISLLFHRTLLSPDLNGADIQIEYYYYNLVLTNGVWNPYLTSVSAAYNSMLSDTILPVILSLITKINGVLLFKICYPLLFSLLPLGLFEIYKKNSDETKSFLAVFFFMSLMVFYSDMVWLIKQQLAEVFLMAFLLVLTEQKLTEINKSILAIIFVLMIIMSHYAISYLFILLLLFSLVQMFIENKIDFFQKWSNSEKLSKSKAISITFILFFIVTTITWYVYVGKGDAFENIVGIGSHIFDSFFSDMLSVHSSEGLNIIMLSAVSPLHILGKYLQYITQFFITIGLFFTIFTKRIQKFHPVILFFAVGSFFILIVSIIVPNFSSVFNTTRLYHFSLISLCIFCIMGASDILIFFGKITSKKWFKKNEIKLISVFLIIFMLFNTGFLYEIFNDHPNSVSLSAGKLRYGTDEEKISYHDFYFLEQDRIGQKWLLNYADNNINIYRCYLPQISIDLVSTKKIIDVKYAFTLNKNQKYSYIYLGYLTVVDKIVTYQREDMRGKIIPNNSSKIVQMTDGKDLVYSNGADEVYLMRS